jgi:hypothetical protein
MRFRKLRIAWSVVWAVAAVLLIVLWVRSYWRDDFVSNLDTSLFATFIGSHCGELYYSQSDWSRDALPSNSHGWRYQSIPQSAPYKKLWQSSMKANGILRLGIAHWVLILLAVPLTAIPWLRWRFSLRTLLIATTFVAVVLGLAVWAAT